MGVEQVGFSVPSKAVIDTSSLAGATTETIIPGIIDKRTGEVVQNVISGGIKEMGTNASSGLDWFGNNGVIGSIGTGINALGNIWNAYNSFTQGKEQLKLMKEANQLARDQYNTETQRYNEQKAEHDAAVKAQQDTTSAIYSQFASNYQTPEQKKSVVERD